MSRQFGGTNTALTVAPGALADEDGGPITLAFFWKPLALAAGGLIRAYNAANTALWAVNPYSDGKLYFTASGFTATASNYTAADGWRLDLFTKADGTAPARHHAYRVDAPGWTHTALPNMGDITGAAVDRIVLGAYNGVEVLNGRLAVVGAWKRGLSDTEIESGLQTSLAAWAALSPAALWRLNQTTTTDPVLDLTGNGANQTTLVGTSVSADEPAGFSYSLSAGPARSAGFLPFFR